MNRTQSPNVIYVTREQLVCTVENPYMCKNCEFFTDWSTKNGTWRCKLVISCGIKMGVLANSMACYKFKCDKVGYDFEYRVCNIGQEEKCIYVNSEKYLKK